MAELEKPKEKTADKVLAVLKATPQIGIAELEQVKNSFVKNYNLCHKGDIGDLMYHRQVVHFKQAIQASEDLQKADQFSLYACFITGAVNGYSFDPQDNEVYLLAMKGKAVLWRQAGAHIRRLISTNQIRFADQAKIVYKGDDFEVENGRVKRHVERFASEEMVAGYVRFVLDDKGADRFFIYRKSDWEAWKNKSPLKGGDNWAGGIDKQPLASFLKTKLVKHSCLEKVWATGMTSATAEKFTVEVDADSKAEIVAPGEQRPAEDIPFEEMEEKRQPAPLPQPEVKRDVPVGKDSTIEDDDDF